MGLLWIEPGNVENALVGSTDARSHSVPFVKKTKTPASILLEARATGRCNKRGLGITSVVAVGAERTRSVCARAPVAESPDADASECDG